MKTLRFINKKLKKLTLFNSYRLLKILALILFFISFLKKKLKIKE